MQREQVNPRSIEIARLSRGKGQLEISDALGIKQGTLSKIESGLSPISDDLIVKLGSILGYPASFFYEEISIPPSFAIHYRKKKVFTGIELQKMQYSIYIMKHIIKKLLKAVNIPNEMLNLTPDEYGDPESIAAIVRNKWKVPRGPIDNLVKLVESKGVIVLLVQYSNDDIDGEVVPDEDGLPIIYLNKNRPPDRQRFTLAHELAHLIMHSSDYIIAGEEAEKEANHFASEFLMPSDDIRYQLDENLSLPRLADLKRHWKVSMASIVMAADRLDALTPKKRSSLWAQLRQYKIKEPDFGLIPEQPNTVKRIFDIYFDELNYSIDDLGKIIPLYKSEIRSIVDLYSNRTMRIAI